MVPGSILDGFQEDELESFTAKRNRSWLFLTVLSSTGRDTHSWSLSFHCMRGTCGHVPSGCGLYLYPQQTALGVAVFIVRVKGKAQRDETLSPRLPWKQIIVIEVLSCPELLKSEFNCPLGYPNCQCEKLSLLHYLRDRIFGGRIPGL